MVSRTADGPRPQVDCDPTFTEVAVGKVATGPTPQTNFPGFAGDRNAVKLMLLRPKLPLPPAVKLGCDTSGMIVRVMRFQRPVKVTRHGFLLSEGELTSFDFPGAIDTAPWGINPAGDITGRYSSADGKSHGFLLSEGDFTTIDVPGAVETAPSGGVNGSATVRINPRGEIVGTYCAAEPCSVRQLHGFLLGKGKSKDEGDKDKSTDDGKFTSFDFPGAIGTLGTGINPRGDIVGIYFDKNGRRHGFLLRSGELNEDADDDGPRDER